MYRTHLIGSTMSPHLSRQLTDETATMSFGDAFSKILHPGLIIFLNGDLGAGKTTLTRGILRGMGYKGVVKSPTYNLVEFYKFSRLYFYHFDFYRFNDPNEWEEAGFRDYFNADSICIVEWPEKAGNLLPVADLQLSIHIVESSRNIDIYAATEVGKQCLTQWRDPECI